MDTKILTLGNCRFELLTSDCTFQGLGAIWIGQTRVRSGRLPLRPFTQSFQGFELGTMRVANIDEGPGELRIRLAVGLRPMPVKLLRDHSFDPIHDTADWDHTGEVGQGQLALVITPARDTFGGEQFEGFTYRWEYHGEVPLFYILDMASWELDGDISGATVISQSSCSAPVVTFGKDTRWSTEGLIHWEDAASKANPVMTHNLPRWASHQAFDFQYKSGWTLLGIFERVGLVRSILQRDGCKAELKTFDKHFLDQTTSGSTIGKSILVNCQNRSDAGMKNLWTRVFDTMHDRARAEFGLREEPLVPRISQNYWDNFTIDRYLEDLLPAAANLGFEAVFVDNLNKSAATERSPHGDFHWNMCCGHEYEPAPRLGGPEALKRFVDECRRLGIRPFAWTNNAQALSSPANREERDSRGWFVHLEDTRQKFGGAYMAVMSAMNFSREGPRQYWVDCLKRIKASTGLDGYLFDSFYNLGFMPIDYNGGQPSTQWRGLLQAFKELQDAGVNFLIESFGPFGSPQHGCPASFGLPENLFAAYKLTVGLGYTTVPTGSAVKVENDAEMLYRYFAHMASPSFGLFQNGVRLDRVWTPAHKQALGDYNRNRRYMHTRILADDALSVLWLDSAGERSTMWNFAARKLAIPGRVRDLSAGVDLPQAASYELQACHTYSIEPAAELRHSAAL